MIKYCLDKITCWRQMQLAYLGEIFDSNKCFKNCDNCASMK